MKRTVVIILAGAVLLVYLLQPVNDTVYLYIKPDGIRKTPEFVRELAPPDAVPGHPAEKHASY